MQTLTDDQAELLRRLRPQVLQVRRTLVGLGDTFLRACPHGETRDPDCWLCDLEHFAAAALREADAVESILDAALLSGPHPNAREKRDG